MTRGPTRRAALGRLGTLGAVGLAPAATAADSRSGRPAPTPSALPPSPSPTAPTAQTAAFSFGFIGDTPYNWLDEQALKRVMAAMAAEPLAFVLHVGDIKSGADACSDGLLERRLAMLDASAHPLVLTPGDNDWTDCHRGNTGDGGSGAMSPLERLAWLRRRVYALPASLGRQPMALEQQGPVTRSASAMDERRDAPPRLPENLRWRTGGVRFCTLHVVGSNNGSRRTPALEKAWLLRQEANARWLNDTVELAIREQAPALVVAIHANLRFERNRSDGWQMMRELLLAATRRFPGPMLLLHGDTHWFQAGTLIPGVPALARLQRVECHGSPFTASWVSIRWNPAAARDPAAGHNPFSVLARQV